MLAVFVNPNLEIAIDDPDRRFAVTIDGNLGYVRIDSGAPFFAPAFGLKFYQPTGFGGLMIAQRLSTSGLARSAGLDRRPQLHVRILSQVLQAAPPDRVVGITCTEVQEANDLAIERRRMSRAGAMRELYGN